MEMIDDTTIIPVELTKEVPVVSKDTKMSEVIPKVVSEGSVIVKDNERFIGIIDKKSLRKLELTINPSLTADKFIVKTSVISDSTTVMDSAVYLYKSHVIALPYIKDGSINSIFDRINLFKMLLSLKDFKDIEVSYVMSSPIVTIDSSKSLSDAKVKMDDENIDVLGVIYDDKFYGLITNDEMIENIIVKERSPGIVDEKYSPSNIRIKSYTNTSPITIDGKQNLSNAIRLMVENENKPIVVTSNSEPVGILTSTDILEYLVSNKKEILPKIIISGLDESTYIYEDEIQMEVEDFANKICKFKDLKIRYISLAIKKIKDKLYDVRVRLLSDEYGMFYINNTDYLLDKTVADALDKLEDQVKKSKGIKNDLGKDTINDDSDTDNEV